MYFVDYNKVKNLQELKLGELRFIFGLMVDLNGVISTKPVSGYSKKIENLLHKGIVNSEVYNNYRIDYSICCRNIDF